ncbi:MAG: prepilin-type N-terminal cleavage/methylation domain-containing protein [Candidatus Omnitrophota bacterium]
MKASTLVEVMISVAILGIILMGIFNTLSSSQKIFQQDTALIDLQQNARLVMSGMVREIRQSAAVNITSATDISFKIPKAINTVVVLTDPNTYYEIRYYLDGTNHQIKRVYPVGTEQVIANNISQLNFCLWDGVDCCVPASENCINLRVLQIQLSAAKTNFSRPLQFPSDDPGTSFVDLLTEKVRLRNE